MHYNFCVALYLRFFVVFLLGSIQRSYNLTVLPGLILWLLLRALFRLPNIHWSIELTNPSLYYTPCVQPVRRRCAVFVSIAGKNSFTEGPKPTLPASTVVWTQAQETMPLNTYISEAHSQRIEFNHSISQYECTPLNMSQAFQCGLSASLPSLLSYPQLMSPVEGTEKHRGAGTLPPSSWKFDKLPRAFEDQISRIVSGCTVLNLDY